MENTNDSLERSIGETLECTINGASVILKRVAGRYDYTKDKCKCSICGSIGIPWGGMFHCDDNHKHRAVIDTGQCFEIVA